MAAEAAIAQISEGMIVGLGSGTTAELAVTAIGNRVHQGLRIIGVSTSERTADQARHLGIALSTLASYPVLDLTIDGAEEIQTGTLDLIKGGGGTCCAKNVASSSKRLAIVADATKIVERIRRPSAAG